MKRWMFSSIQEVRWMLVTLAYTAWGSGSKGGLMRPASILLQLTELNQGWILTSITPCRPREHPSLLAGAFCSSPSHRDLNQDVGDEWMIYETKEGCYDASGFNSIKIFWGTKYGLCWSHFTLVFSTHRKYFSVSNRSIFTIGFLFYALIRKIFIIALIY